LAPENQGVRRYSVSLTLLYVSDINKSRSFSKTFFGYEEPFKLDKPDGHWPDLYQINEDQYIELVRTSAGATSESHLVVYE